MQPRVADSTARHISAALSPAADPHTPRARSRDEWLDIDLPLKHFHTAITKTGMHLLRLHEAEAME